MKLRLAENFRALFYAPFYATDLLGHFTEAGLEIERVDAATPGEGLQALRAGTLEVVWTGPVRVMRDQAAVPASDPRSLVCFGEVVGRDPFCLVARADLPWIGLHDLRYLRLGTVSEVDRPWLCLRQDLADLGIDPAQVQREASRTMPEHLEDLLAGRLDVVQLFEPHVTLALQGGARIVWAAAERGPTAYTCLVSTRVTLRAHLPACVAMVHALQRTDAWIAAHGADALAGVVGPLFPRQPRDLPCAALRRLAQSGVWCARAAPSRPRAT